MKDIRPLAVLAAAMSLAVGVEQSSGDTMYDLSLANSSGSVSINDGIFRRFAVGPSGSGNFDPFVRVSSNRDVVQGVNVDMAGGVAGILDEDNGNKGTYLKAITLAQIPIETIGGKQYYQFILDNNQNGGNKSMISLETMELWVSSSKSNNVTKTGPSSPYTVDRTLLGTLVYSLDAAAQNNYLRIDTEIAGSGSGKPDVVALIPRSLFGSVNPSLTYLYLYSEFGRSTVPAPSPSLSNNDGFEEWARRTGGTFDPNPLITPVPVPLPASVCGGLVLLGLLGAARRSR